MYQIVIVLQVFSLVLLFILGYRVIKLEAHVRRFSNVICFKLSRELEDIDAQIRSEVDEM